MTTKTATQLVGSTAAVSLDRDSVLDLPHPKVVLRFLNSARTRLALCALRLA